ncbi:uncharacterized protein METZ01_LOCUS345915 [marine metagenome]|uniref:Uncharacterized protein n=1 Tax=marine metagenome TaxID=408172 RepID=A0A382R918_9ZZZZ
MKKSVFRYTKIIAIFMPNRSRLQIIIITVLKLVVLEENHEQNNVSFVTNIYSSVK